MQPFHRNTPVMIKVCSSDAALSGALTSTRRPLLHHGAALSAPAAASLGGTDP